MRVLLDTSVLVSAVVKPHVHHERSLAVLERVVDGIDNGFIAAHSLAEMYAVLTSFPLPGRHSPEQALLSIEENILENFIISDLNGKDYTAIIRDGALAGIQGGTIYDAVLLKSAKKAGVDRIFTLNLKHFQAVAPKDMVSRIIAP